MRCEVIAEGCELLLGHMVDTNSSRSGEQLTLAGIDSHFQAKVGDNPASMVSALEIALAAGDTAYAVLVKLPGDPERIRQYGVINLLDQLRHHPGGGG